MKPPRHVWTRRCGRCEPPTAPRWPSRHKTILRGALQLAVLANVIGTNPVRDVSGIKLDRPQGATALTADEVRELLKKLGASEYCRQHDLVDPITLFIATGLRRSELLGLRWADFDADAGTIAVTGKALRVKGQDWSAWTRPRARPVAGPSRCRGSPSTCCGSGAGCRTSASRKSSSRRRRARCATRATSAGNGVCVRDELGAASVSTHSFRKTVATLIDDEGLSARIGADQLGHARVSMTQNVYMTRGRVHAQVADLLDRTVTPDAVINDE